MKQSGITPAILNELMMLIKNINMQDIASQLTFLKSKDVSTRMDFAKEPSFEHWVNMTEDIIEPLANVSEPDISKSKVNDEYISATEDMLNDMQRSIPHNTEEDKQIHSFINSIKDFLSSLKSNKFIKLIVDKFIIPFLISLLASYTFSYMQNTNDVKDFVHSEFNKYQNQQNYTDNIQNTRIDKLEKYTNKSEPEEN